MRMEWKCCWLYQADSEALSHPAASEKTRLVGEYRAGREGEQAVILRSNNKWKRLISMKRKIRKPKEGVEDGSGWLRNSQAFGFLYRNTNSLVSRIRINSSFKIEKLIHSGFAFLTRFSFTFSPIRSRRRVSLHRSIIHFNSLTIARPQKITGLAREGVTSRTAFRCAT